MVGILYIVATPIGNLEGITARALRVLGEVDIILAEDTRITKRLLSHYDIETPTLSYHQHSSDQKKEEILSMLNDGKNLALVSDAGTPGISDPGNELIDYLLNKMPEFKVIPIPGASAITSALSISGFRTNQFVFLGFLPKRKRNKLFEWLDKGGMTFAFYESPRRIVKTLKVLEEYFGGEKRVFVAREMTKKFEETYRGRLFEIIEALESRSGGGKVKGELVVVVEG